MTTADKAAGEDARMNEAGTEAPEHGQAPNHNFLMAAAATIRERYDAAKGASKATLEDLRLIGETLNEVKETLAGTGKGAFGKWCEEQRFPFDPSWRARLMKLAANWADIMAAVEALPEDKQKWSVDGVMAIWSAAKKASAGSSEGGGGEGEGEGGEAKPEKKKRETEAEKLRRELAEALARVAELEAENASLKGGKGSSKPSGSKPEENPPGFISGATKLRAAKVWGLYTKGATDGEKAAAKSRLEEMAEKVGMAFDAFVAACNLK
ncbi:hypothetical protein [Bosea sp. MMO-172]|uniref:hypothetical protein n=1 Tax=Bosea sp. MMO-172 TaxID=3127885 RepID=UPI00301898D9